MTLEDHFIRSPTSRRPRIRSAFCSSGAVDLGGSGREYALTPGRTLTPGRLTPGRLRHRGAFLLFDRGAYRHLARFEGARAVVDRLMEMRANAFAIELLVPRVNLSGVTEERLGEFAKEWQVSTQALANHLHNYRGRGGL